MATAAAIDPRQPTGLLFDAGFEQPNADLVVRSPYSGEELARVAMASPEDVDRAVAIAAGHLPAPPPAERAAVLERAARLIADRAEPLARTIAA
ncbi:MAG TPA: aldehyde dehydrogenase family protein, partial [Miltoncostaeaceae bacterium]|nr:aldehyde dehydrogenase family protein [Miltoncostaeaceae bacterium]